MTYTTLDPLIATLFAVECRNHGQSIILATPRGRFAELDPSLTDAYFRRLERSVTLDVLPLEFTEGATHEVDVEQAINFLKPLTSDWLPERIHGISGLASALDEALARRLHLPDDSIRHFAAIMRSRSS
jgi:hypothetical protein